MNLDTGEESFEPVTVTGLVLEQQAFGSPGPEGTKAVLLFVVRLAEAMLEFLHVHGDVAHPAEQARPQVPRQVARGVEGLLESVDAGVGRPSLAVAAAAEGAEEEAGEGAGGGVVEVEDR